MSDDILAGLTPEQREAVLHREGPLLILAGAGSGKTRVVTRRIARLVTTGVPASSILAITFTNKAAGEMRERVEHLLPHLPRGEGPTVSTFHSFAVRVLREHAPRLGWGKDFAILDEDDQLSLVREAAVGARVDVEQFRPHQLASAIGRAKEKLDDAAFAAAARTDLDRAVVDVLPLYRALTKERNAFDFDDLVANVVLLLDQHEEARAALEARLHYVLVDEYQDTNHAQYRLARLLAGARRNLCVCGDPDQSIYGWRGADMRNILQFEEHYPGAKVVKLERNYRSTATILQGANAVIARNTERKDKQLIPAGEQGFPIEVKRCLDEEFEAEYLARRVEETIHHGVKPAEIAVIFRAAAVGERFEAALLRRNIPCATKGAASFYERAEIKDALAFVRVAVNPRDDLAALRALKATRRGVGKATIDKVHELQRRHGISIVEACGRAGELALVKGSREGLESFAGLVGDLARAAHGPAGELVKTAVDRSGLAEQLRAKGGEESVDRARHLDTLVEAAREADRRARKSGGGAGARDFLDRLSLLDGQDKDDDGKDQRVVLTTIHAAKGLEFDVVFVPAMEEGIFPHPRALEEGAEEEERRLAYVAFTRARKRLVLTWAGLRAARMQANERRRPSRFLHELPIGLLLDPERKIQPDLPEWQPPAPPAPDQTPERRATGGLVRGPGAPRLPAVAAAAVAAPAAPKKSGLWSRGLAKK